MIYKVCEPLSSDMKRFDGTDHKNSIEQFLNAIQASATYQLGPEHTHPIYQYHWHLRGMAIVATASTDPTWFNDIGETIKLNWLTFTSAFLQQFDNVTVHFFSVVVC